MTTSTPTTFQERMESALIALFTAVCPTAKTIVSIQDFAFESSTSPAVVIDMDDWVQNVVANEGNPGQRLFARNYDLTINIFNDTTLASWKPSVDLIGQQIKVALAQVMSGQQTLENVYVDDIQPHAGKYQHELSEKGRQGTLQLSFSVMALFPEYDPDNEVQDTDVFA